MEEGSSVAHRSHGMRGNRHKLEQERIRVDIRKTLFAMKAVKKKSRLSSEAV